jgi:Domain of unknown function (DUF4174)
MKLIAMIFLALLGPLPTLAQSTTPTGPVPAAEVVLADLLYVNRAVIVFADSPQDPNFIRQMELLARDPAALADRDAMLIFDTDPAARTEARLKFRPRGFSLVLVDKDGTATIRKPLPWELREITNAIDKFPSRRQEVLERSPAGR